VRPPEQGDTWLELSTDELPVATAYEWAVRPDCGAVVLFSGTVRDHAEGRTGVTHLTYEAYEEQVVPKLAAIAEHVRQTWPMTGRIVLWHRIGKLDVEESSVIVAVSSPHRGEAFEAARFGIDAVKSTAPIWKRESWEDGEAWGLNAHEVTDVTGVHGGPAAGDDDRGTKA
jgi:molybdopterin synthase catalytic subunit